MIGYLGPAGTFSYEAVLKYLQGKKEELKEYSSIYTLIKAVDNGEIDSCVVPIENSLEGSVNTTLDTLAFNSDLYICGEYTMHIKENLMALPEAKIESRPEKKELGRYIFFIDTDGNIRDENLKKAWDSIKEVAYKCKFLGSYKKG